MYRNNAWITLQRLHTKYVPFAWLLTASVTLWSCSAHDEDRLSSQFLLDGKSYSLESGALELRELNTGHGVVQLWSVTIDSPAKDRKRHAVSFDLYTNNDDHIPEGTYRFDDKHAQSNLTFARAGVTVDYDRETNDGGRAYRNLKGGSINIKRVDAEINDYIISFDLSLDSRTIRGYFHGVLERVR